MTMLVSLLPELRPGRFAYRVVSDVVMLVSRNGQGVIFVSLLSLCSGSLASCPMSSEAQLSEMLGVSLLSVEHWCLSDEWLWSDCIQEEGY